MGKAQQRYISVFSAGREAYLTAKREYKNRTFLKHAVYIPLWIFMAARKRALYKTLNRKFRSVWAAGWRAGQEGIKSGKVKKMIYRIKLACSGVGR